MDSNPNVVNEQPTPALPSNGNNPTVPEGEGTPSAPGSKTPSELLLVSLQEEREKRKKIEEENKKLEEELLSLKSFPPSDDEVYSDEGKLLKKTISTLEERLNSIEEEKNLERVANQYPILREKLEEFKEFRETEHPRAKLDSVAKLFLAENGLLEPQRKGLENPTGGERKPIPSGMTTEEIKKLRETNYRKYTELLTSGQIKFEQ